MSAPIRPEHREAAAYALRLCNWFSKADYLLAEDAVAQALADADAAAVERATKEAWRLVENLDYATGPAEGWQARMFLVKNALAAIWEAG